MLKLFWRRHLEPLTKPVQRPFMREVTDPPTEARKVTLSARYMADISGGKRPDFYQPPLHVQGRPPLMPLLPHPP